MPELVCKSTQHLSRKSENSQVKKLIDHFEKNGSPICSKPEPRQIKDSCPQVHQSECDHAEGNSRTCGKIREPVEERADRDHQRLPQPQPCRHDEPQDRFRENSCGPHLCRDVERRESLGKLVPQDVCILREGGTSEVQDLHRVHAGPSGTSSDSSAGAPPNRGITKGANLINRASSHSAKGQSGTSVSAGIRERLGSGLSLRGVAGSSRRGCEDRTGSDAEQDASSRRSPPRSDSASPCPELVDNSQGVADDSDDIMITVPSNMQRSLNEWIEMISKEFDSVIRTISETNPVPIDLLEVFCQSRSELTHQVRQMGRRAERFSYEQGDLSTVDGRKQLFSLIIQRPPRHLWFSPTCGPWTSWNQLNMQKSLQLFDAIRQDQMQQLYQLALGIVLLRHQIRCGNHLHWEQPGKSLMFRSPLLKEVFQKTIEADFDLCNVGNLCDPQSGMPMKKNLCVRTTSSKMHENLHGQWCKRNHEHQQLAGSCKVNGEWVSRTRFSENYPRKFARRVAKQLISLHRPKDMPICRDQCIPCFAQTDEGQPDSKRRRVHAPVATLPPVPLEDPENCMSDIQVKRRRLDMKQTVHDTLSPQQLCLKIVQAVEDELPRVGRVEILSGQVHEDVQRLFPEKQVIKIMACKGTDRTTPPPKDMHKSEAPFRRSIIRMRQSREIKVETTWEKWDNLAQRQIVRKGHPTHVNITVFACNISETARSAEPSMPEVQDGSAPQSEAPISQSPDETAKTLEVPGEAKSMSMNMRTDLLCGRHGPKFQNLQKAEQMSLLRIHANLGHPSAAQMSIALRQQGYPQTWIEAARDTSCSVCQMTQAPKIPRPGSLKKDIDFNDKIAIDGVTWTNGKGKTFHFYHVLDLGTNYQSALPAPNRSSSNVISFLLQGWMNWAGPPNEICTDAAGEFVSDEFEQFLHRFNIKNHNIAPGAHWQQGRAERHGSVLQSMLTKYDHDIPIDSYEELLQGLVQCTHAKNANSTRHGFSPDMLVFGKGLRLPGSLTSDDSLPSHALADEDNSHGVRFREFLAKREAARKAFFAADNDSAIRRAALRRTRPFRGAYQAGEWVMIWRETKNEKRWIGPMKVVSQDGTQTVWCSHVGKLIRAAPEHVRTVSAVEAQIQGIQETPHVERPVMPETAPEVMIPPEPTTSSEEPSNQPPERHRLDSAGTEGQPDNEPEIESTQSQEARESPLEVDATQVPVPEIADDELIACDALICQDVDDMRFLKSDTTLGWKAEYDVNPVEFQNWLEEDNHNVEFACVASTAKKQHSEVKLAELTAEELEAFKGAKNKEIQSWLSTGTVQRMLRHKLAPEQILRCRWILTWKALDEQEQKETKKTHKPKARLVVLGYLDPELEHVPRDSPTLSRQSRMLALQLIASSQWVIRSFDVKSAFLQGKPQEDRVLGLEPVPELREAMKLGPQEVCRLAKSAYGLVDAPFMWYRELDKTLIELGFVRSPFDPCLYTLHEPGQKRPSGIIGMHVDDGLCGGNAFFMKKLEELEKRFAFGSKKAQSFCFTGIDIFQHPDKTITLSQEKYVSKVEPIHIEPDRRKGLDVEISPKEKESLRALIGSLQYAAVNTRPDLSSRLSHLQSKINCATIQTLIDANRMLHEAKRFKNTVINIQPIDIDDLRFLTFSDASFASKKDPNSHAGMIIMTTHKDICQNYTCTVNAIAWGCKKIQRVVTSTLAAETTALNTALDQVSWLKMYWGWLLDPNLEWQRPKQALQRLPITIATAASEVQAIAATDCKSLFDLVTRNAPPNCSEWRTQLLAKSIKDMLSEGTTLRWVHSGAQLADALTKIMETSFLRRTLELGRYRLHDELETLKTRADHRSRLQWLKEDFWKSMSRPTKKESFWFFWECESFIFPYQFLEKRKTMHHGSHLGQEAQGRTVWWEIGLKPRFDRARTLFGCGATKAIQSFVEDSVPCGLLVDRGADWIKQSDCVAAFCFLQCCDLKEATSVISITIIIYICM